MPNVGDNVNITTGNANAYTGAVTTTNEMTPGMKVYWDTQMLENMRPNLVYSQFGRKHTLPANHGNTIEWRKWKTFNDIGRLQEGVIPTGKTFGQTATTASIAQYGDYVTISDLLDLHHVDPVIAGASKELSAAAAKTLDTLTRDAILAGATSVMFADAVNTNSNYAKVSTPVAEYELSNDPTKISLLTPDMVLQAKTMLEAQNVPKRNGYYVCVVHPYSTYDLMKDPLWNDFHKYEATEEIFAGEVGELYGVRFVVSTNAPIMVGDSLFKADQRYLTIASESGYQKHVLVPGVSQNFIGVPTVHQFTVTEDLQTATTDLKKLIGQYVLVESGGAITDRLVIAGIDAKAKHVFTEEGPVKGSAAEGDFLLPGNGGAESKTGNAQIAVFASIFFGDDAFGTVDPSGGALSMIIKQRGEIGGPLEQFSTVGVKFETGTKILYPERCLVLYHTSAYSDRAQANWRL